MTKRRPITSPSEAVRIAQGALRNLQPPSHVPLDDGDRPFWQSVIAEFARADWSEHQLELAAMLARTMALAESEQRLLRAEGFVVTRETGTTVSNPRARTSRALLGDIMAMRRSLALHARARSGDSRNDAKRRDLARALEAGFDDVDDLISRPPSWRHG